MFLYRVKHSGGDISDQENNKLTHFINTNGYANSTLFHFCSKSVSLIIIQGNSQEAMTLAKEIKDNIDHHINTEAPHWKASLPTCDFEQMIEEARRWLTHLGVDDRGIGKLIYILYFTTPLCALNLQQHLPFKWQEPYKRQFIDSFVPAFRLMTDSLNNDDKYIIDSLPRLNSIMQNAGHHMRMKQNSSANFCWWDSDCDQAKHVKYAALRRCIQEDVDIGDASS